MSCREYRELIGERLAGLLGSEDAARLDAHLARCPHCAAFEAQERALVDALASGRGPAPAFASVALRVHAAVRTMDPPTRALRVEPRVWGGAALLAASLALVAVLSSMALRRATAVPEYALFEGLFSGARTLAVALLTPLEPIAALAGDALRGLLGEGLVQLGSSAPTIAPLSSLLVGLAVLGAGAYAAFELLRGQSRSRGERPS